MSLSTPAASTTQTAFAYLGTERGLLVEIAMHELTVLPSGDLTAVDREPTGHERSRGPLPTEAGAQHLVTAGRTEQAPFCLTAPTPTPTPPPHHPRAENGGPLQRPISLWGWGALAHLPLVPMQQGRPLISQSMCSKPVWLLWACSVQI